MFPLDKYSLSYIKNSYNADSFHPLENITQQPQWLLKLQMMSIPILCVCIFLYTHLPL